MKSLKTFAAYVLDECLEEYITAYMGCMQTSDVPILKAIAHLTREQLDEVAKQSAIKFLTSLRDGTALQVAEEGLRAWEANDLPTVPKGTKIHPSDLILLYACQKFALYKLLPVFAPLSADSMAITTELEQYYTTIQNNAVQLLFKLQQKAEQEVAHKHHAFGRSAGACPHRKLGMGSCKRTSIVEQ